MVAEAGASRVREELALRSKAEGRVDGFAARELHFEVKLCLASPKNLDQLNLNSEALICGTADLILGCPGSEAGMIAFWHKCDASMEHRNRVGIEGTVRACYAWLCC